MPLADEQGGGSVNVEDTPMSVRLTNDDFRRLLMTPRHAPGSSSSSHPAGSVREAVANASAMPPPETEDKNELRRKKKSFYAALKKQEDNKLAELAEKYRDRARERRDGANPDYNNEDNSTAPGASSAYRAVAPDIKSSLDAKERRRQMIQESKFLGGDMEHTHLVKGLDYALLQKVRSEIQNREQQNDTDAQLEELATAKDKEREREREKEKDEEDGMDFKTQLGRDVYKTLAAYRSKYVERNEMFIPGRMAYIMELEESAEWDIPLTITRSRAELPALDSKGQGQYNSSISGSTPLTNNDIVINKLTQVLSYLRQGGRSRKGKKNKDKSGKLLKPQDDSIYGEIGDYVPNKGDQGRSSDRDKVRDKERDRDREYRDRDRDGNRDNRDRERDRDRERSRRDDGDKKSRYFDKPLEKDKDDIALPSVKVRGANLLSKLAAEPEGYAECYPGLREMDDAIDDSDDEVDYSKMDVGNKKGPIGRWDFDTQEEYSAYMNQKEALPKAAFQYGLKTQDGRKTRKTNNRDKNDKAELDREWQQIQNIIQKRKAPKDSGHDGDFKKPKY